MKIRNGFVANSSSSSFLIYGTVVSRSSEMFRENEEEEEYYVSEMLEDLIDKNDPLSVRSVPDGGELYIGMSWNRVKDDETGKQFKERVERAVRELLDKAGYKNTDIKFGDHEEAWYS